MPPVSPKHDSLAICICDLKALLCICCALNVENGQIFFFVSVLIGYISYIKLHTAERATNT